MTPDSQLWFRLHPSLRQYTPCRKLPVNTQTAIGKMPPVSIGTENGGSPPVARSSREQPLKP